MPVLLAIDDAREAIFLHRRNVACAQEAVGRHDFGGPLGPVPVARHHLRAAHAKFAGFANRKVSASIIFDGHFG